MYGAALEPHFRGQPAWFRWLAPVLIVDQTFAVATAGSTHRPQLFRRYWLTLGLTVLTGWVLAIAVGMLVGPALPEGLPLDSAATSCLIGLLVPRLSDRAALVAALTGATVAAFASALPAGLGVLTGTVVGLLAGAWCTRGRS
jgi:predicted branched-subunit amino acid permease